MALFGQYRDILGRPAARAGNSRRMEACTQGRMLTRLHDIQNDRIILGRPAANDVTVMIPGGNYWDTDELVAIVALRSTPQYFATNDGVLFGHDFNRYDFLT